MRRTASLVLVFLSFIACTSASLKNTIASQTTSASTTSQLNPQACLNLDQNAARLRVLSLKEVGKSRSSNISLDYDHAGEGPIPNRQFYWFWHHFIELPERAGSLYIGWYAVDPCTGKIYDIAGEEVVEQ